MWFSIVLIVSLSLATCPNGCSGHGKCNSEGHCECFKQVGLNSPDSYAFTGYDCSQRACPVGQPFSATLDWVTLKTDEPITLEGGETSLRMLQQQCSITNINSTLYYNIMMDNYGKLSEEGGKASVYSEDNYIGKGDILRAKDTELVVKFNFDLISPSRQGFNMTFKVSEPRSDLSLYHVARVSGKVIKWPNEYIEILGLYTAGDAEKVKAKDGDAGKVEEKKNTYQFACYDGSDILKENPVNITEFELKIKKDKNERRMLNEDGENRNAVEAPVGNEENQQEAAQPDNTTTAEATTEAVTTIPTTLEPTLIPCTLNETETQYEFVTTEANVEGMTCHLLYSLTNKNISIENSDVKDWLFKKNNNWYYGTEENSEVVTPPKAQIDLNDDKYKTIKEEMVKQPEYIYIPTPVDNEDPKKQVISSLYVGAKITVTVITSSSISKQVVTVISIEYEGEYTVADNGSRMRLLANEEISSKNVRIQTSPPIDYGNSKDTDLQSIVIEGAKDDKQNPHKKIECSNQGLCNRETGECQCFDGFEGIACQRITCPNNCNGNGRCVSISQALGIDEITNNKQYASNSLFACKCDPGRRGADCSLLECPSGEDPLGGSNVFNKDGDDRPINPNNLYEQRDCSGRGTCDYTTGLCKCYSGYTGEGCQETASIN